MHRLTGTEVNSALEKRLRYLIEKVAVSVVMERVVREESRVVHVIVRRQIDPTLSGCRNTIKW